jgi:hypothetical protein
MEGDSMTYSPARITHDGSSRRRAVAARDRHVEPVPQLVGRGRVPIPNSMLTDRAASLPAIRLVAAAYQRLQ